MQGEYDLWVVAVSYLVAVVASFTALEIAGKVMQPQSRTSVWVMAGSLAMGTGIWSMHFVGMEAFQLPIDVIYDIPLTILSWVAAVAVSALALRTLSRMKDRSDKLLDPKIVIVAGVLMGAGICVMHYSGMFAMRLSPGISYDPMLLAASVLIAISASIVTLMIAVALREVTHIRHLLMRMGAALVMGVAITGMHYTGMAAASFAADTLCITTTGLEAGWTVGPITTLTMIILVAALFFSIRDTQQIKRRVERERMDQEAAERLAFEDTATGLHNRSWLNRLLANHHVAPGEHLSLLVLETEDVLPAAMARSFGDWLKKYFPGMHPSAVQPGVFALVSSDANAAGWRDRVVEALNRSPFAAATGWQIGLASCPEHVETPFRLLAKARVALQPSHGTTQVGPSYSPA